MTTFTTVCRCGNRLHIVPGTGYTVIGDISHMLVCPHCGQRISIGVSMTTADIEAYRRAAEIHTRARSAGGDERHAILAEFGEQAPGTTPRPVGRVPTLRAIRGLLNIAMMHIDKLLEG